MLFFGMLFFITTLFASENQINRPAVDLLFVRPKNKTGEQFKSELIDLVNKYEKDTEVKKLIVEKLEEKTAIEQLILSVSQEQISQILPYLNFIDNGQGAEFEKKTFAQIVQSGWVNKFHDKYKEALSARTGISPDNLRVLLGLLSVSIAEQGDEEIEKRNEQDDFLSKEVKLLQLFNIVYKRIFIDVCNVIEKKLKNEKEEIKTEITGEFLLIELCNALQTVNLELKIDQNNQVVVPHESMKNLTDKVIDLIGKRLQEEDEKKEKNALNIAKFLITCNIPKDEFAAMTRGQQGMAILISSILIDSPLGKEFSKNHYEDYKRMLLDLERIIENIKNDSILNKKIFKNNYNDKLIKNSFELAKNNIYLALSQELMAPEFINTRCIIKNGNIYFNESFLVILIKAILEKINQGLAQDEHKEQDLQVLAALQKSASMPATASTSFVDHSSKKLSERQMELSKQRAEQKKLQEEEAKRKQEEVEHQRKVQLEKIEKAKKAKEEKAKKEALILEQKTKKEAELKELKRQKELEKQRILNEARKKEQEVQEKSRLLKIQLDEKEKKVLLVLDSLLREHKEKVKEALFRAKQSKDREKQSEDYKFKLFNQSQISSSKSNRFIHNPYARNQ